MDTELGRVKLLCDKLLKVSAENRKATLKQHYTEGYCFHLLMVNAAKKLLLTDEKGTVKYIDKKSSYTLNNRKKLKEKLVYCIYLNNTSNYKLPVMNDTCSKQENFFKFSQDCLQK